MKCAAVADKMRTVGVPFGCLGSQNTLVAFRRSVVVCACPKLTTDSEVFFERMSKSFYNSNNSIRHSTGTFAHALCHYQRSTKTPN